MSEKPYSAVIAAPAGDAAAVNAIFEALGYGPDTLTLGASGDGVSEETVLYNHGWVDAEFASLFSSIKAGKIPDLSALKGIDVPAVLGRLSVSISSESAPLEKTAEMCSKLSVKPLSRALPEVKIKPVGKDKIEIDTKIPVKSSRDTVEAVEITDKIIEEPIKIVK